MSIHSFDLILSADIKVDKAFYDLLARNDMLDALVIKHEKGPVIVNFLRSDSDEQSAIKKAKAQMLNAGYFCHVRRHTKCHCGEWGCLLHE